MPTTNPQTGAWVALTQSLARTRTVHEIYEAALDALESGLGVERSSILLFDADGVMRFKAWRGLSDGYRRAVEGHTPWRPDSADATPIVVRDVAADPSLDGYLPVFQAERIAAMTFIPLVSRNRVIGKFMLYYAAPAGPTERELDLAAAIAAHVAFAVERTAAEAQARRSEERLRFALDAAAMGTWDWDLGTNAVEWSDNLEAVHGLPAGTFDGTFASYEREIHPEDRERVLASVERALAEGVPHEVEYRIVAPDGTVRWCEGKGRVEYDEAGRPARMTGVCMMVTRRKTAELARLAAAEESSRLKDEFLATLSHELRTPLNAIVGWVQMLQAGGLSAERARQAVDVIGRNATLQARLIEDILDVSRIIAGKLDVEREPVSVAQLVDSVLADLAPAAETRRVRLERNVAPDLPPLEGDPKRLHQVLSNVLSNAVKFTPEGGEVVLRAAADGPWLELTVRDTGVGIAPEFLPYIFERFRQADGRSTRTHDGLGLGLAIARHLVERHGGAIEARSEGAGRGTTVTIRLPVSGAPEAPEVPTSAVDTNLRLDASRILVLDDQADARDMLAALLEQRGACVTRCDSAEAALARLRAERYQVVVADIAMPHVDGYDFIRRLRESGDRTPAVAVTAFARPEDRRRAMASGYAAYCPKPIDAAELTRTIRDLVAAS